MWKRVTTVKKMSSSASKGEAQSFAGAEVQLRTANNAEAIVNENSSSFSIPPMSQRTAEHLISSLLQGFLPAGFSEDIAEAAEYERIDAYLDVLADSLPSLDVAPPTVAPLRKQTPPIVSFISGSVTLQRWPTPNIDWELGEHA